MMLTLLSLPETNLKQTRCYQIVIVRLADLLEGLDADREFFAVHGDGVEREGR
jgi:hypothetical protein